MRRNDREANQEHIRLGVRQRTKTIVVLLTGSWKTKKKKKAEADNDQAREGRSAGLHGQEDEYAAALLQANSNAKKETDYPTVQG